MAEGNRAYAVIADYRFVGLYRTRSGAEKRVKELLQYPIRWRQRPSIYDAGRIPSKYKGVSAYSDISNALKNKRYGKRGTD